MSKVRNAFAVYLMTGLMMLGFTAQTNAQIRNERNVRDVLRSLNSKVDDFKYTIDSEFSRNSITRGEETEFNDDLRAFETSLAQFDDKFQRRRENDDDVRDVLTAAKNVNAALSGRRYGIPIDREWASIRVLLDRLASNYQVTWTWDNRNDPVYSPVPTGVPVTRSSSSNGYGLSGTYQLDQSRSENAGDIAAEAIRNGNIQNNTNAQSDLENKLKAPEQLSIDVRGSQVTLASSNAAALIFTADGRDRTENLADGRTLRVRSTLRGQELTVSSLGGDTDYTITFVSIENGKALRVTRRITTDYLRQTIFAESIYQKTDAARLGTNPNYDNDGYSSNDPQGSQNNYPNNYPITRSGRTGDFIVPNGTILTGLLEKDIDTKISQNNDRFELVVQSPNQFRGAIIEGYISGVNRSGKVSGRSQITFNFEKIRLSNGQNYEFAGFLQSVTDETGKVVKIDNEGAAKGDNQTKETVKRGGIGAGIGAVIGAIAGGGKGAAIGAIIGGGAGAGSVVLQGKDDLTLRSGSSITIQASAPNR